MGYQSILSDKNLKLKFIFKFFTKYFFYGYLFLFFTILFSVLFKICLGFSSWQKIIALIPFFMIIFCLSRLIPICFSTKNKWRYFKINNYRLKTRTYNEEWFKYEMYEPCMRLIIKDLCTENNLNSEYRELYEKYSGKNVYVEKVKERLLQEAYKKNEGIS